MPPIDLSGQKFGKLTAIKIAHKAKSQVYWQCKCECGNVKITITSNLRNGTVVCCGCIKASLRKKPVIFTENHRGAFNSWNNIRQRCYVPTNQAFDRYGGRGIVMAPEWRDSFEQFFNDLGPRPQGTSIERIDNNKGYFPGNCRWATYREQARNKRNTRIVYIENEGMTRGEASERFSIGSGTIAWRDSNGRKGAALIAPPQRQPQQITVNGESYSIKDLAIKTGIAHHTLATRINRGWSVDRALTEAVHVKNHAQPATKKNGRNNAREARK